MISKQKLIKFANLIIQKGVALSNGQDLYINCPVELSEVAHVFTKQAYLLGAKNVVVNYLDDKLLRITYENASIDALKEVPNWFIDSKKHMLDTNACYISIAAEDPNAFLGVDPVKISARQLARSLKLKFFHDAVMSNGIRWCVVSVPTKAWADVVFKGQKNTVNKLWSAIAKAVRLDKKDPIKAWDKHIANLDRRAKKLNDYNFDALYFSSSNGTALQVGLAKDHLWLSAEETAKDGVKFIANLPTEEVFTAPHKDKIFGVVKNSLPLVVDGVTVDDFSITFDNGKVVDYSAKTGYDALKRVIETDEGTLSLGEVALIGKSSPIAKSGILFYNTLFDENASCHLALGKAYPTTLKNGENLSEEELLKLGANNSTEHCDFMIGTADLKVIGIKEGQKDVTIFENGDWVI